MSHGARGIGAWVSTTAGAALAACNPVVSQAGADGAAVRPSPGGEAEAAVEAGDGGAEDVLDALFRDGTPQEIARELEAMAAGQEAGVEAASEAGGKARAAPGPRGRPDASRVIFEPVPIYKGVDV